MTYRSKRLRSLLPGFLMAAPAVVVFVAMFMLPMALAFVLSLTDWNGYSQNLNFIGFENYVYAFENPRITSAVSFTFMIAAAGTLFCNLAGLGLAVLVNAPGVLNTVARTIFFYPYIISALVIGFLWSAILSPQGAVNNAAAQLGLPTVGFLTDPTIARITVIATVVWASFGFHMILYIAGLKSIPADYYEAATVDGAGQWMKFRYITFPLLAPVVTVNLVLSLVGFLKVYDLVLALTAGGPGGSTQTIVYQIFNDSFQNGRLGFGAAQSVLLLIVTAVVGLGVAIARRSAERQVSE